MLSSDTDLNLNYAKNVYEKKWVLGRVWTKPRAHFYLIVKGSNTKPKESVLKGII